MPLETAQDAYLIYGAGGTVVERIGANWLTWNKTSNYAKYLKSTEEKKNPMKKKSYKKVIDDISLNEINANFRARNLTRLNSIYFVCKGGAVTRPLG